MTTETTTYNRLDVVRTATGEKATLLQREAANVWLVWIRGEGMTYLHETRIAGMIKKYS